MTSNSNPENPSGPKNRDFTSSVRPELVEGLGVAGEVVRQAHHERPIFNFDALVDAATRPYAGAGKYAYEFTRGKLRHDPVFRALLKRGLLPEEGLLLDLGCGLGVLPALLHEARNRYRAGEWPSDWASPPQNLEFHGIELAARKAEIGQQALQDKATILQGDIRSAELPDCSVAVILDVLLYLSADEQRQTLQRVAQAIRPGGMLLMREGDADGGWRFHATRLAEQMCCLWRGQGWYPLHYRTVPEWTALLQELGFSVEALPMSEGTPFSNVMFVAMKPSQA
ncbi:MAG: class I SAM-dependent methyltransferase [Nitrosomonadales bacterium]|nr:class I SAM-dependent methyltransferase [Nitrosomonadales bacterium]